MGSTQSDFVDGDARSSRRTAIPHVHNGGSLMEAMEDVAALAFESDVPLSGPGQADRRRFLAEVDAFVEARFGILPAAA